MCSKMVIPRYLDDKFLSHFYDKIHVEPITKIYSIFVKQRLDNIEYPALITELTHNMDTDAYMEQSENEGFNQPEGNK